MPIVAERPTCRRLLTVADLARMPRTLPSGDVNYELHDGEIITMAPPGFYHGRRAHLLQTALYLQAEFKGLGQSCCESMVVLRRNPDRVVAPDALFLLKKSLPVTLSDEGYLETIPDLVIEVRSKNDTNAEVQAKNDEYIAAGVKIIWVVDAEKHAIFAHEADGTVTVFRRGDVLTCPILPGFAIAVNDVMTVH